MANEQKPFESFEKFPFARIFQTFRIAIQPNKLIIAFAALFVICLAGWIMDFSKTVVASEGPQGQVTELEIYISNPTQFKKYIEDYKQSGQRTGVFAVMWQMAATKFHGALNSLFSFNIPGVAQNIADYFKAILWAVRYQFIYSIILLAINLVVISIAGGCLCRMAAQQAARGEKPGLGESLKFSMRKFTSFFTTPLTPVGIIIALGLFIFILGLLGNIPRAGEIIVGVSMPLALIAGALTTVVVIGTVAGFNLMFPAVAYDGSDCFDAISRSFSYVYSKPWHMGFYTALASIYGAICYTFVRFFAFLLLWTTHLFLRLGVWVENSKEVNKLTSIWPPPQFMKLIDYSALNTTNWSESIAGFLVYIFALVIVGMVVAFIISFYFSANTIIYALMRNKVDNTTTEDIYTPVENSDFKAAAEAAKEDTSHPKATETDKSKLEESKPQ
ncbi:MAG: hypothetical protein JXB29_05475 [Sedimentisphaerales bacterium]|nr:hypothetical protein [Sedimentisphaerales bacterium]